ncbi:MAG: hypothetical protein RR248_03905 [Clostridia bacterium]
MEYLQIVGVPAIATIVYWVINLMKYTFNSDVKFLRFVPLLSALIGSIMGVLCYYLAPELISANNIVVAIIVGGASGLSATGTHQIIKQLGEKDGVEPPKKL